MKKAIIIVALLLIAVSLYTWQKSSNQAVVVTPQPSPASVDTTSWKTYRNEKYGFEFRYPSDWNLVDATDDPYVPMVGIGPVGIPWQEGGAIIGVSIHDESVEEYLKKVNMGDNTIVEQKSTLLSGNPAISLVIKNTVSKGSYKEALTVKNNKLYVLNGDSIVPNDSEYAKYSYSQVWQGFLKDFKF